MKPRKGDIMQVTFLDHVEDSERNEPFAFTVWGRVHSVDKKSITVASWDYADAGHTEGKESDQVNRKRFTILKSTITSLVMLEAK